MTAVFACGPYRDGALLAAVLGAPPGEGRPARLRGHRLSGGDGRTLPRLRADASGGVDGAVHEIGDRVSLERLAYHAACLGGVAHAVLAHVDGVEAAALTFAGSGQAGDPDGAAAWPAQDREATWRAIWREAAGEIVSYLGTRPPETVRSQLTGILQRADARRMARASTRASTRAGASGLGLDDIRIDAVSRPYAGFFAVEEFRFGHARFDGGAHPPVDRTVFVAADAVTVLPYDPERDRVLLVEQIRAGPLARGDPAPWILEPVAGRIEPGDGPEATAFKEAREEAGLELSALHRVAGYYPSTGCFSEFVHSFVGIAALPREGTWLGGLAEEGEDIRAHVISREALMARIVADEMPDAPLILTAWWLAAHHRRLRSRAVE